MALPDRNTGLPAKTTNPYQEQSFTQNQNQTTGPRTDTGFSSGVERANQAVSSASSALNTTPTALAAMDQLIGQMIGRQASTVEQDIPLLEIVRPQRPPTGGIPIKGWVNEYYVDPKTGKQFNQAEGLIENNRRMQARKKWQATPGAEAGTPEQQRQVTQRQEEITRNRATQGEYSKTKAFADAQALVDKSIADALEKTLPQITAAIEGSGTSKGSMAALLTQRAAEKAGTEGAALGAQTAVAYGGIQTALANTLEMLTRSDPNSPTAMLIQALIGTKGIVSQQAGSQSTDTVSSKQGQTEQNVGAQNTIQDTLKQILQPLGALNELANYGPSNNRTPTPTNVSNPGFVHVNDPAPSNFDNRSIQVTSNTEDALFGEDY